ncbi:SRPBCC family protein [Amycolatopsis regifaucium]|uniref:Polyketide cyclase n=1 Tax=Amycolatopsis regifaucium TaxID=546365 RepID=A0A154MIH8_9PSEU|nr:SRPBCC family protein [Amycolatopsis regifaucium]KZB84238.1 polyketide cyclase [Amycolatopsis regifaucium]OKA03668.1 polyketide cyclase [Amycolatopsis regifaucium]SFJ22359.1 Polyketide cyclase / dehydrase and lipid transport [Amycolatopsis regifaucium]
MTDSHARHGSGRYRFRDTWVLPASPKAVFDAVVDLAAYPLWWRDVRSVSQVDEDTAELVCRSRLPYALTVRMHRDRQDEREGRVRVLLSGDLEGTLAGALIPERSGTRLEITQEVEARKPLLRKLDRVARPVFRINHALMMRRGQHGLRGYLLAPAG